MKRLSGAAAAVACATLLTVPGAAAQPAAPAVPSAQSAAGGYPARTVTIIVPFGAGGSADVFARAIAQRLSHDSGHPFVVENRPGAGAVIGTQAVAKAAPDGYTLLMMSNTQTVNETLLRNKPYQLLRDFVPVAPVNEAPLVLVTRADLGVGSLAELLKRAKASPGKLTYASSGTGTPYHMAGELFKSMAGVSILHIPYRSSGGARTDVIGGQVDMMFDAVATMTEMITAGRVRALATTGGDRSSVLPALPTMAEQGLPRYSATLWLGILAPKGTPAAIVDWLNASIARIVREAAPSPAWAGSGVNPLTMSPVDFGRYLERDIAKWRRVIESANIKAE